MSSCVTIVGVVNGEIRLYDNAETGNISGTFPVRDAWKVGEEWHDVVYNCRIFGKRAETIKQYFPKGKPISVTGKITGLNEWTSKSGRVYKEIKVDVFVFDFVPREQLEAAGVAGNEPSPDDLDI
jgi:single-stranded DNA-binding protein